MSGKRSELSVKQIDAIAVDWALANNVAADWALSYAFGLVRDITDTTRQRLQTEIAAFIQNQETLPELTARLNDVFGASRAELISTTEVTRAFAQGNLTAWRESGVTEGKRWNTANDEIVQECPVCWPLHETVIPLDDEFETILGNIEGPPAHTRCRCWLTPVPIGSR